MTDAARCHRCGAALAAAVDLCAACLSETRLDSSADAGTFLYDGDTRLTPSVNPAWQTPATRASAVGDQIGPYRLVRTLGEGGMGVVYLAEQTEPIRRTVALKVIKLGMDTRDVVGRFESERQALALMDHPNIARVIDAGATPDGRPFFVMEHVDGQPLTDYCDARRLSTRARLALLVTVCGAVQHAHQKGVIHRDLKPSNVLVSELDGAPTPKIIDFGIAKATAQRLTERTMFTEHGQFIGTPEYMSPEQTMGAVDIDATADIYAIGVMLYELLTGALPFEPAALRRAGLAEMQRIIREDEPSRPSTRVDGLGAAAGSVAAQRQTDAGSLSRELRGDLDWITLRAMEKDRTRRYASASELAADVQRYLHHEPVVASPPSLGYRAQKFVRRHRLAVTAAGLVAFAVVAGLVASLFLYSRAERARQEAERHACLANVLAADMSIRVGNTAEARRRLDACPPPLRRWEWQYLDRTVDASALVVHTLGDVERVLFAPDGRSLRALVLVGGAWGARLKMATANLDGAAYHATREPSDSQIAVSPDGRLALVSSWTATRTQREGALSGAPFAATSGAPSAQPAPSGIVRLRDFTTGRDRFTFEIPKAGQTFDTKAVLFRPAKGSDFILAGQPLSGPLAFQGADTFSNAFEALGTGRGRFATLSGVFPYVVDGVFSPDGRRVAAWSWTNDIRVWDTKAGTLVATLVGHTDAVTSVAFNQDASRLVSASYDRTAVVWDVGRQQPLARFPHAPEPVLDTVMSPDGRRVATSSGGGVRLWELGRQQPTWTRDDLDASACLALSPDARLLAACSGNSIVLLEMDSGLGVARLRGHSMATTSVAFSSDSRTLVSGSADSTARVWHLAGASRSVVARHDFEVGDHSVGWLPDGPTVVSSTSRDVRFSPVAGSAPSRTMRVGQGDASEILEFSSSQMSTYSQSELAVDRIGAYVAANDGAIVRVWKAATGEPVRDLTGHTATVRAITFSGDSRRVYAAATDNSIRSWDLATGRSLATASEDAATTSIAVTPDDRWIVTGEGTTSIKIRDAETLQQARTIANRQETIEALAIRPDGTEIFTIGTDKSIRVVTLLTGQTRLVARSPEKAQAAAYSPDGERVAAALGNGSIVLWDAVTLEAVLTLQDDAGVHGKNATSRQLSNVLGRDAAFDAALSRTGYTLGRPTPVALSFSPDGLRLASGWGLDGTVRVFNATPRTAGQHALELVDALFSDLVAADDVISTVNANRTLTADVREAAVRVAQARGDDPAALNSAAWIIVKQDGASAEDYQRALRYATTATRLTADHPGRLNTLALAQYRAGRSSDALETLARIAKLRSPTSNDLVVSVMARCQLGRSDAARPDPATLRAVKNPSADLTPLIAEAAALMERGGRK